MPVPGRSNRLTQAIDVAPTILELYGVVPPPETEGFSLLREGNRDAVLFGYFGGAVNVTDGRYTYHRFPDNLDAQEVYRYTVMPTHIRSRFTPQELSSATLAEPFGWTKDVPLLKVPVTKESPMYNVYGSGTLIENDTRLYDLASDPGQSMPIKDPDVEVSMIKLMRDLMAKNEASAEAFTRFRLS